MRGEEGLDVLNVVRSNYDSKPLVLDNSLSKYAEKKAVQNLLGDDGEIIVSEDRVGFLFMGIYTNNPESGEVNTIDIELNLD